MSKLGEDLKGRPSLSRPVPGLLQLTQPHVPVLPAQSLPWLSSLGVVKPQGCPM